MNNFVQRREFDCDEQVLALLARYDVWTEAEIVVADLAKDYSVESVTRELARLIANGALVAESTANGEADEAYELRWPWGSLAGFYHFGIKNTPFASFDLAAELLEQQSSTSTSPPLFSRNGSYATVIDLPRPREATGILEIMHRRRTSRRFAARPVALDQFGDVLYAGFGITAFIEDEVLGPHPLKLTPSGGARNPYEGYVWVANVQNVRPGIYHYSGMDHSLGELASTAGESIAAMLGNQPWFDDAAFVLLFVANFPRTAWKYHHANAYRVVLMEAGHIGQNIALAAAAAGLASASTAAIHDAAFERLLELDGFCQSALYAYAVGHPAGD